MTPRPGRLRRVLDRMGLLGRSLALVAVGALLGALLAGGGVPAAAGRASVAASATPTATSAGISYDHGVPVPQTDRLREQAIDAARSSVVEVINVGTGLGSGVIMTKDGYIVTNNHVVKGAQSIDVALLDGQKVGAKLVGADPVDDLAVIKINMGKKELPAAHFDNSSDLALGQTVLALGNPLGIVNTVTDGIVSARRTLPEGQGGGSIINAVQTSAPINPGNSGGALIDLAGHVVGIPTLTAVDPEFNAPAAGVGFAIPSNTVMRITQQIMKYGKVVHSGRAALGVSIQPQAITPNIAQQYNLPVDHGLLIAAVSPGGPASKAGLQRDDIIVKAGGVTISQYADLLTVLATKKPGDTIAVTVVNSSGQTHTYNVKLGELNVNQ